jgi:hypothetical protein
LWSIVFIIKGEQKHYICVVYCFVNTMPTIGHCIHTRRWSIVLNSLYSNFLATVWWKPVITKGHRFGGGGGGRTTVVITHVHVPPQMVLVSTCFLQYPLVWIQCPQYHRNVIWGLNGNRLIDSFYHTVGLAKYILTLIWGITKGH